jgi:dihydrodipicolinate synthase/N-acetylneuraminate lyase
MNALSLDGSSPISPRRKITGISAILLPFTDTGAIDWHGYTAHCLRTADAGLIPAVNMDTGFGNLLDINQRNAVLDSARSSLGNRPFVAGVSVNDSPGQKFNRDGYLRAMSVVVEHGATPVIFQSYGLTELPEPELIAAYEEIGNYCDSFIAFELGKMFAPFGKIYSLDAYRGLLGIQKCSGAKHSSLKRSSEWERLALRNRIRPDFRVYTGNDLAIDMVMYGSDYLLGLSTFAPDFFAKRDKYWELGDARFNELNDWLQYLGFLSFRSPVPAYKHSAAMFLKMRGWIGSDETHPLSPKRPAYDRDLLKEILDQLAVFETD